MSDMRAVIVPKSDQWNYDDFQAGPITFTIEAVRVKGGQEQPVDITLAGTPKYYRPCKSMARVMVAAWGPDSSKYVGRSMTLYGDPKVKWGGMEVGGIRISHMSDIDETMTMALTVTRANKKPFTVKPLAKTTAAPAPSSPSTTSPEESAAATQLISDVELQAIMLAIETKGIAKSRLMTKLAASGIKDVTKIPASMSEKIQEWVTAQK